MSTCTCDQCAVVRAHRESMAVDAACAIMSRLMTWAYVERTFQTSWHDTRADILADAIEAGLFRLEYANERVW